MKLSVIIPVYNEINTLDTILEKVIFSLPDVPKEIIIIDDFSNDGTRQWLASIFAHKVDAAASINLNYLGYQIEITDQEEDSLQQEQTDLESARATISKSRKGNVNFKVIYHQQNFGKGAALRSGFEVATGEVLVIQDADLEYDPQDWLKMWRIIAEGHGDVVFGSRFYGDPHRVLYFHHLLGNKVISNFINILCNTTLSDIEVCYKMFRREVLEGIELTCNDFGFEVEFTVKITKSKPQWRLYETGIAYYGRTYAEGKKISWRDGIKALWYIVKFRFFA